MWHCSADCSLYTFQVFIHLCSSTLNESSALDYTSNTTVVWPKHTTECCSISIQDCHTSNLQYSLMCTYMYIWHDSTSEESLHFHMASFDCHIQWSHLRKEENTADWWTRWLTVRRANLLHYFLVYLLFVLLFVSYLFQQQCAGQFADKGKNALAAAI